MSDLQHTLDTLLDDLHELRDQKHARTGSRYVGPGADPGLVAHVAAGGELEPSPRNYSNTSTQERKGTRSTGLTGLMRKALSEGTGSSGGFLVPVEVHEDVVGLIRSRSAVLGMRGTRVVPVRKQLDINYLSSGATATWTAENAPTPVSEQTFASSALLRPRDLTAMVPVSDRLLRDADDTPDIEDIVRQDLAEVVALRADASFLRGTGTGNEPTGVRNVAGVNVSGLGPNGAAPDYSDLMDVVALHREANAPFSSPGWMFNGRLLSTLEKLRDSSGRFLKEAGLLEFDQTGNTGRLLGFPFRVSGQTPTNLTQGTSNDTTEVFFSPGWSEAWVGQEHELTIEASNVAPYFDGTAWQSAWQNRQHVFRTVWTVDFGLRRPSLFSTLVGVRP